MHRSKDIQTQKIEIPTSWVILFPLYQGGDAARNFFLQVKNDLPVEHCLIINDGSRDNVPTELVELGFNVINHPQNLGKAFAIETGLNIAQQMGYEWALCMDSDGQHLIADINGFISNWERQKMSSMILGKRNFFKKMPWPRILSNSITSFFISILANQRIYDSQNGFRLYCIDDILKLNIQSKGFQWESEVILKLIWENKMVIHTETTTHYDQEVSSIHPIKDILRFVKMYLRLIFERIKY